MSVLSLVVILCLFFFSIKLYQKGQLRQETLVSLIVLFLFMTRFLGYTCRRLVDGMMTIGSMIQDNDFIKTMGESSLSDGTDCDFISGGEICFKGVSFGFHPDDLLFQDFNMVIPARSHVLLLGDSGSGKTTFLRLLLGFFSLRSGRITIDGQDISSSNRSYLRKNISYINQSTNLFDRPLMENIMYGCKNKTPEDVIRFLDENNLSDLFRHFALTKNAGRGGEHLSGGMRQVVLLMRCYFKDSPIVIIDEATSNIDARNRGHATVMINHFGFYLIYSKGI